SEQLTNGRILRGDGISYLVNSSDIRTDGIEIAADKVFRLERDTFTLGYAANFNKISLRKIYDAPPVLASYGITLLDSSAATNLK
ncbi:hypothetical protein, partial [Campylobacter jejuni]|uniref:hypothetical protein n=1 Tax=Campylobacter jejuni TaxID=197 RepID=UPI0027E16352